MTRSSQREPFPPVVAYEAGHSEASSTLALTESGVCKGIY